MTPIKIQPLQGLLIASLISFVLPAGISAQEKKDSWADLKYQSAAKCGECHALPKGNQLPSEDPASKELRAWDVVLMTEYSIWKTHDKHAQAYAVLVGPRGKRMGEILGQDVTKQETGCLNCHAMGNLSAKADFGGLDKLDGVSCAGCHGPSSKWLGEHAEFNWRKKTASQKHDLGMRDLRDPEVRSMLCVSCHIGNAAEGKVVTHAMFAAGHPPLPPIEIATFSKNEPQHWRDPKNVPYFKNADAEKKTNYHLEDVDFFRTRLALVGALVSLKETVKLAADRADFANKNPAMLWPEIMMGANAPKDIAKQQELAKAAWPEIAMAHSDCFACHHDLKYPGFRQVRGYSFHLAQRPLLRVSPGRPLLRSWPTSLVEAALIASETPIDDIEKGLNSILASNNERPFGNPETIKSASAQLTKACDVALAKLRAKKLDKPTVARTVQELLRLYTRPGPDGKLITPDYESARQLASLLEVVTEEINGGKPGVIAPVTELSTLLNIHPYQNRISRVKEVLDITVRASRSDKSDFKDDFINYLADISNANNLVKLVKNPNFLVTMITLDNSKFNSEINKAGVIEKLQKFDDDEEVITLKSIADYDPELLRKKLAEISEALGNKGK